MRPADVHMHLSCDVAKSLRQRGTIGYGPRHPLGESAFGLRRVFITGVGCVTPCGIGADELWSSIKAGRSGIGPITTFNANGCGSRIAGEVIGFKPEDYLAR